jgi:hypothetical protein
VKSGEWLVVRAEFKHKETRTVKVAEVKMGTCEARNKWLEYRAAVKKNRNPDDEALRKAYRFLSQGKRVLSLHEVMKAGGVDDFYRPRLAIAYAHWRNCYFRYENRSPQFRQNNHFEQAKATKFMLSPSTFPPLQDQVRLRLNARALVPSIPPSLRPAGSLEGYCILWEAEWETVPVDPILLRPLGRDLYLVCAQWDLTPLERSILFQKV